MARDISVGANRRRLVDLGYSVTSASNPDRIINAHWSSAGQRATLGSLSDDPAAIFTCPTPKNSPELHDHEQRRVVLLILTAYLQSDAKQFKAVSSVLERYKLTSGPYVVDGFGNRTYPLCWNSRDMLGDEHAARLAFPDDDNTVLFQGVEKNARFEMRAVGEVGAYQRVPLDADRSHILPLAGKWEQGHLLDTPRRNLPELFADDVQEIIADCERARWSARPAASAKEAA